MNRAGRIEIVCIGKLTQGYVREGCERYLKMLSPYADVRVTELPEARLAQDNDQGIRSVLEREGASLERYLAGKTGVKTALCITAQQYDSQRLAEKLRELFRSGQPIFFIIGGSYGLSESVIRGADDRLSLSSLTFPHQLCRLILLEQVYRSLTILAGRKYHK